MRDLPVEQGLLKIDRFLGPNGYNGLSPQARTALFRPTGKHDLAAALDDIAIVSKGIEEKLNQFRNPSGTARSLTATNWVIDAVKAPAKVLVTMVGARHMATVLSKPATAASIAN